ncbi:Y-family DNA polymerase [Aliikangiella coralliicola]|uniref:DNA polymerase Y family protein n=1 Tax=Aliikangiella coralliicola TaxID=2592383 RepID=A0A545U8R6_9GAMM|nr:DNA polymerase Y family protein [Aliikangiella coralliicola]TQV85848.1 DNA polymerase Y family protein [Aliikangiella coralliicola]
MWLSIRLPLLPLETLCKSVPLSEKNHTSQTQKPQAVIEDNLIFCANQAACEKGIKISQTIASAFTFCDSIQLFERNQSQEQQQLNNLALLLYSFSPSVAIEENAILLVEIVHSLKLFHGLENLLSSLKETLDKESISYRLAIGHTPKSAEILSFMPLDYSLKVWQNKQQKIVFSELEQRLSDLPVELMNISPKAIAQIQSIGAKKLGELTKLPEKSIRKRFGEEVSHYLLKLYNKLPDPKDYFIPPENFLQRLEFIDVIHHRQGLLFPIKRLIKDLCRFLTVKQKNCQCLHWELFDSEKNMIGFDVLIADSRINDKVYVELTQLHLEHYTLHAPIEAISLTVNKMHELNAQNKQLFEDSGDFKQTTTFINKIQAKLGNDSCYQLQQKSEHIPELASCQVAEISNASYQVEKIPNNIEKVQNNISIENNLPRPSWLLEKPEKIRFNQRKLLWHGELKIISSQERITNYWWKKKVARDYFLAEHDNGTIYWVFYDLLRKQWFLHGVYS